MLTGQQYDKTVPPDNRHVWLRQRDGSVVLTYETGEIGSVALDRRGRVVLATHRRRHSAIAVCLPDDECRRISRAKPDDGTNPGPDWELQLSITP